MSGKAGTARKDMLMTEKSGKNPKFFHKCPVLINKVLTTFRTEAKTREMIHFP